MPANRNSTMPPWPELPRAHPEHGAALAAYVDEKSERRFDDFELTLRSGTKLESFIERAQPNGGPARRSSVNAALVAHFGQQGRTA
jgi:hypothetical protein